MKLTYRHIFRPISDESAPEKPTLSRNNISCLHGFERWLEYLDKTKGLEQPAPIYSYHTDKQLANTRSLIRDGKYNLTDEEYDTVLTLLQEEVIAAYWCQNDGLHPVDKQKLASDYLYQETINRIV